MMGQKKGKKTLYWGDKVLYPTQNCRKIQYDNPTAYQRFRMATYTKEIVIIKQSYSLASMITV